MGLNAEELGRGQESVPTFKHGLINYEMWQAELSTAQNFEGMKPTSLRFTNDGHPQWAGMGDFLLVSPNGAHTISITYRGEPPRGDSYHSIEIDGKTSPGYAWGCLFGFSKCSRYAVFSWMPELIARHTVVVDIQMKRYFVLPEYIYEFDVEWPMIVGTGSISQGKQYRFAGTEQWIQY